MFYSFQSFRSFVQHLMGILNIQNCIVLFIYMSWTQSSSLSLVSVQLDGTRVQYLTLWSNIFDPDLEIPLPKLIMGTYNLHASRQRIFIYSPSSLIRPLLAISTCLGYLLLLLFPVFHLAFLVNDTVYGITNDLQVEYFRLQEFSIQKLVTQLWKLQK